MRVVIVKGKTTEVYECQKLHGKRYTIRKQGEGTNRLNIVGPDRCSCQSYTYRRKCKHLDWFRRLGLLDGEPASTTTGAASLVDSGGPKPQ